MKLTLLLQPTSSNDHQSNHVSVEVSIPHNSTVEELIYALPPTIDQSNLIPSNINLWYSGQKLQNTNTLESYGITSETAKDSNMLIYITLDEECPSDDITASSAITKKNKPLKKSRSSKSKSKKCTFPNCNSLPLRMVGDCQLCQGKFCSKHRLLESHLCKGLKSWKDTCFERNAIKLQSEQTVAPKV